jgi:hypothetical protein
MSGRKGSFTGNVHLAGEFFVAAELAKLGYAVSLTLGNAKAIDLHAERDGRVVSIQVKARRSSGSGWPMPSDRSKILDGVLFVLVKLNGKNEHPEYFILTPEQVRDLTDWGRVRSVLSMAKARPFRSWCVIEEALNGKK